MREADANVIKKTPLFLVILSYQAQFLCYYTAFEITVVM